jgi:hypothetical protein
MANESARKGPKSVVRDLSQENLAGAVSGGLQLGGGGHLKAAC